MAESLVNALREAFGIQEVGCPPARHRSAFAMEVFPLGAMPRLFGAPFIYKKKTGRSWAQCCAGLGSYLGALRGLRTPSLAIPLDLNVTFEIGVKFKDLEDRIDAVLCAYLAALAWIGKAEAVGDLTTGYIVLPCRSAKSGID